MEITFNTPALLFPAISLLLLAYTNRFLAIANLVRKLYDDIKHNNNDLNTRAQIISLKNRLNYIRFMQALGVCSFLLCVITMYCIFNNWLFVAHYVFAGSLISLLISLFYSLIEIIQSTNALELLLKDLDK